MQDCLIQKKIAQVCKVKHRASRRVLNEGEFFLKIKIKTDLKF